MDKKITIMFFASVIIKNHLKEHYKKCFGNFHEKHVDSKRRFYIYDEFELAVMIHCIKNNIYKIRNKKIKKLLEKQ